MTECDAYVKMAITHAKVSDLSVEKMDLPQASEDIPEEYFGKVPAEGDGLDREDDLVEDGEFDAEGALFFFFF
ncbi:hypothetical protein Bca4012_064131 [Brassica carinata]